MALHRQLKGFTLVEVLISLAITAFVSMIAYTSLSSVIVGVEGMRETTDRTYEINRAWMIISRDLRQFVPRPVRDEFGEEEPALSGGPVARFALSFTRAGWHNPNANPRSNLQRINYRIEDEALWRDSYTVLDRAGNTEPQSVLLLDGVEYMELAFLASLQGVQKESGGSGLDTSDWVESWIVDDQASAAGAASPPVALEIRLQLDDWGEMRRMYALPPL
jgi:general secretion pathway protein J